MDVLIGHVWGGGGGGGQTTEWSNVCSREISYCFKYIIILPAAIFENKTFHQKITRLSCDVLSKVILMLLF